MTAHPGPLPVPARITAALDAAGLWGPEVDRALGGEEPMVDDWEAGRSLPTPSQVERLAALTGWPTSWFYRPIEEREHERVRHFLCERDRREHALTIVEAWISWDGVRHLEELAPPKPARRAPRAQQHPQQGIQHHPDCPTKTCSAATCGVCKSIHKGAIS